MNAFSPPSLIAAPRTSNAARAALRIAAAAIVGVTLAYLAWTIAGHWREVAHFSLSGIRLPLILLAAVFYGASLVTTALAWPAVLAQFGHDIGTRLALAIGLTAQVGKYVPGNVAHYVGRAALAKRASVPLRDSGTSTLVEFTSALVAAGIVAACTLAADNRLVAAPGLTGTVMAVGLAALIILPAGVIIGSKWLLPGRPAASLWLWPVAWLLASFLVAGLSLSLVIDALAPGGRMPMLAAIGIYSVAWSAGFIVPGAPAGLGVREAVMIGALSTHIGAPAAIMAAAIHRLLTALVDGTAALAGLALLFSQKDMTARD